MATPGWYPDPYQRAEFRWFDGTSWTGGVASGGATWVESESAGSAAVPTGGSAPQATAAAKGPDPLWIVAAAMIGILIGAIGVYVLKPDRVVAGPSTQVTVTPSVPGGQTPTPQGSATPTPTPGSTSRLILGLQEGLGQLDSYHFLYTLTTIGPTTQDRSDTTSTLRVDRASDARHLTYTVVSSSAEEPEPSTTTSDTWTVGNRSCTGSDGEFEVDERSAAAAEVEDGLRSLLDLQLIAPSAQLIGEETVNGVATRRYSFSLPGLGQESGAQVLANQGEYWTAVDGGYLVKYQAALDVRTGPEGDPAAEQYQGSLLAEVTNINQPVAIAMDPGCG